MLTFRTVMASALLACASALPLPEICSEFQRVNLDDGTPALLCKNCIEPTESTDICLETYLEGCKPAIVATLTYNGVKVISHEYDLSLFNIASADKLSMPDDLSTFYNPFEFCTDELIPSTPVCVDLGFAPGMELSATVAVGPFHKEILIPIAGLSDQFDCGAHGLPDLITGN
eukprot:TRINITY_DN2778_c0_g4::TRINITY_DN2778_c0_g4_i1::g.27542::m.27542 TRINITY_DN2778_c0_g4::TRINITY_DN2778_c0_g4_i1::g.27542  ORF type:complete len:173 (-),score=44.32 TRINITY_DN2778_c0_g4_i1:348-866(-)